MPRVVSDSELAAYRPRLERLAVRYSGRPGIDHDDLVQEGWIYVWQTLRRGHNPTDDGILRRMKRWVRKMNRQRTGVTDPLPHQQPLSLEEHGHDAVEE